MIEHKQNKLQCMRCRGDAFTVIKRVYTNHYFESNDVYYYRCIECGEAISLEWCALDE